MRQHARLAGLNCVEHDRLQQCVQFFVSGAPPPMKLGTLSAPHRYSAESQ